MMDTDTFFMDRDRRSISFSDPDHPFVIRSFADPDRDSAHHCLYVLIL